MGIRFRCHACEKKLNVKSFLGGKRGICPHCGAKIAIPPAEGQPPVAAGAQQAALVGAQSPAAATQARAGSAAGGKVGDSSSYSVATASKPARPVVENPAAAVIPAAQSLEPAQPTQQDALAEAPGAVWYVRPPSGGQYGPASADYMRRWLEEGRISADSLVWRDGWADWQPAATALAGLIGGSSLPQSPVSSPVGLPESNPTEIAAHESSIARRGHRRGRKSSNRLALVLVIGLGLLAICLLVALLLVLT